jgi:hypothetical protein
LNKKTRETHSSRGTRVTESTYTFEGEFIVSQSVVASMMSGERLFEFDDGAGAGVGAGSGAAADHGTRSKRSRVVERVSDSDGEDDELTELSSEDENGESERKTSAADERIERISTEFFIACNNTLQYDIIRGLMKKYFSVTLKRKNVSLLLFSKIIRVIDVSLFSIRIYFL